MPQSEEFARDYVRRITELERYAATQGTTIAEAVKAQAVLNERVLQLEQLAQSRAITEAREDERDKALYERLTRMETSIADTRGEVREIKGIGAKALWVFISAILVAVATFLVKGGFA